MSLKSESVVITSYPTNQHHCNTEVQSTVCDKWGGVGGLGLEGTGHIPQALAVRNANDQ